MLAYKFSKLKNALFSPTFYGIFSFCEEKYYDYNWRVIPSLRNTIVIYLMPRFHFYFLHSHSFLLGNICSKMLSFIKDAPQCFENIASFLGKFIYFMSLEPTNPMLETFK